MEENIQSLGGAEQILTEAIANLRKNPERYKALQTALQSATTDQERVKELMHFATNESELAALIPARARGTQGFIWTTVTVTTVLILESTAV
jgi:hypothetical protein